MDSLDIFRFSQRRGTVKSWGTELTERENLLDNTFLHNPIFYTQFHEQQGGHMSSMPSSVLKCMLLCALMGGTECTCMLKNHTIWIERQDCGQCVAINTTICSGYCYTQDTNLSGRFGRTLLIQRGCVPLSMVYRAASVPGCPQDVNPQLYYPVAQCCSCRRCNTRTHHCVRSGRISHDRCTTIHGGVKRQNQPALEA